MKVYLKEISDNGREYHFTEAEDWVRTAINAADETETQKAAILAQLPKSVRLTGKKRPIRLDFELRKINELVILTGEIDTHLRLLCSRCATPFDYHCDPMLSGLYSSDPQYSDTAGGATHSHTRHKHDFDDPDPSLEITFLKEEFIDLGEAITEQIMIKVPFQPLCKPDCQGLCPQCGTDLNTGRCLCKKQLDQTPFSVLAKLQKNKS